MKTDYKIQRVTLEDDGTMRVFVRFYEVEMVGRPVKDEDTGLTVMMPHYDRRVIPKKLTEFASFDGAQVQKSGNGVLVTLPYQLSEKDLLTALDKVLAADTTRTPIEARRVASA